MIVEPLTGACRVKVTEHRTRVDWALLMRELVDVQYPQAEVIVLVTDNLNTHDKASLYEAFAPEEARRIADKLEIHLHAQARQLAGYGRAATERAVPPMPGPVDNRKNAEAFGRPPAEELAPLYHERWEIETALDEFKTHLRGARIVLRSKRPDLVRQEFYGFFMAHFAVRALMHEAALKGDADPDRLSYVHAVRVIRRKMARVAALPPSGMARLPSSRAR